jgi:hippurate hydrolase
MFQPGEEGHDGARHMLDEGVLEAAGRPVDAAFALHVVSSMLPNGIVATRPGPFMAAVDTLRVAVRGAGGHGSMPHLARDPIPAAAEMVTALQTLVTRRFDVFDPVVVTVGSFHAGTQSNVIPDEARFEATIRSFSPAAHGRIGAEAVELCRGIARAHGLEVDVECEVLYPVTVNDDGQSGFLAATAAELFGPGRCQILGSPVSGSEDFSLVLESVPGAMAFLGACPRGSDPSAAPFNHSPRAMFDEDVLADGASLYAALALGSLS